MTGTRDSFGRTAIRSKTIALLGFGLYLAGAPREYPVELMGPAQALEVGYVAVLGLAVAAVGVGLLGRLSGVRSLVASAVLLGVGGATLAAPTFIDTSNSTGVAYVLLGAAAVLAAMSSQGAIRLALSVSALAAGSVVVAFALGSFTAVVVAGQIVGLAWLVAMGARSDVGAQSHTEQGDFHAVHAVHA